MKKDMDMYFKTFDAVVDYLTSQGYEYTEGRCFMNMDIPADGNCVAWVIEAKMGWTIMFDNLNIIDPAWHNWSH
jgi:hypothetical protein